MNFFKALKLRNQLKKGLKEAKKPSYFEEQLEKELIETNLEYNRILRTADKMAKINEARRRNEALARSVKKMDFLEPEDYEDEDDEDDEDEDDEIDNYANGIFKELASKYLTSKLGVPLGAPIGAPTSNAVKSIADIKLTPDELELAKEMLAKYRGA